MAIVISTIVAGAIYSMYITFFKQQQRQDLTLEAEQNARAGLEMMERELLNAGYLAATVDAITQASATTIQFRYKDPSDASTTATFNELLDVTYTYNAGTSMVTRKLDDLTDASHSSGTVELIPDVKNFNITYYDANGAAFVPTDQASRNTIRYVDISVVTQTSKVPEGMTSKATFALTIHLKLRNIDIAQSAADSTPPDVPTGVEVRDTGRCGRLQVKWTLSTAGDVAGYRIGYGFAPGDFIGVINIPKGALSDGSTYSCTAEGGPCTISPTVSPLQFTPSDGSGVTTYYIAVRAYDNGLNFSAFSPEVSGAAGTETLAGSNYTFGSGSNDSTINPKKPAIPGGFSLTGADGDVDGKVRLTWSAYDTATYPDVTGFRLYRKPYDAATPFTYPIDPSYQIGTATVASTVYDDSGLLGCVTYQYAIAPVNCDTTLITNDPGDAPGATQETTPYYEAYNYSESYGDGSGALVDSPAGSDTAPPDSTVPSDPAPFSVRAGYKRVAVSFTQPADPGIDRTCIYIVPGATPPAVDPDPLLRDAVYCSQLQGVPGGNRLPEYNGVFPTSTVAQGQSLSLWNNSASGAATGTPSLAESGTYSYTAVSYDLCGNRSTAATSSATTTLCGEDPGPPDGVATKPPAATGLTVSGCGGSPDAMELTWTQVSSNLSAPSSYNNPYDLAGYRLFKSTMADFSDAPNLLNPVAPFWAPPYSDTTVSDGGVYYYRVYSSDCPFEKGDDTGGSAPTASQMMSMLSSIQAGPVYPARLNREMKYPVALTDHREVLTGVNIDALGNSAPAANYKHDSVTMFLQNNGSSLSSMTITGMSLSWVGSGVYLREVWIGGGSSGIGLTKVASLAVGATTSVTGNDPYTAAVNNVSFSSKQIPGGGVSRNTPVKFVFTDSSGNPVDMRNDKLLLTFNVTNDSTGTTTCTSYLTVSGSSTGIVSPQGPTVASTVQSQPTSPTFPYIVPGASGLESVPVDGVTYTTNTATGGSSVAITSNLNANTLNEVTGGYVSVASAKVYYAVTGLTTGTAPDWTVAGNYTAVAMTNTFGNTWRGTIPAQDTTAGGKRIWYYVVAIDNDGNFDRWPKTSEGAAVYDQKPFIVCDVTPKAPTNLTQYSVAAGNAAFSWPRVTQYTNNGTINTAIDPLYYRVYRKNSIAGAYAKLYDVPDIAGGAWVLIPAAQTVAPATNSYYVCEPSWLPGNCIYWDYIDAQNNDLTYYIQSKNSCGANLNLSSATGTWRECQGAGAPTLGVTPASIKAGESLTITINDCTAASSAIDPGTSVAYNLEVNSISYTGVSTRSGASLTTPTSESTASSGYFPSTLTTSLAAVAGKLTVAPTDLLTDTVTVSCTGCTPASVAIPVAANACDFAPAAPTALTGTRVRVGNSCTEVDLSWTASTSPDVVQYYVYRKTTAAGVWTQIAVAGGTTYTDTTPTDPGRTGSNCNVGTVYYFLKAADNCSTGALLSPISNAIGPK
ncbi:MAG: hypothetical protein HZB85_05550 [Deltaproteobacteria bacterium]|nr:hypothetical protein [Deltaproteobacteria bacterium]